MNLKPWIILLFALSSKTTADLARIGELEQTETELKSINESAIRDQEDELTRLQERMNTINAELIANEMIIQNPIRSSIDDSSEDDLIFNFSLSELKNQIQQQEQAVQNSRQALSNIIGPNNSVYATQLRENLDQNLLALDALKRQYVQLQQSQIDQLRQRNWDRQNMLNQEQNERIALALRNAELKTDLQQLSQSYNQLQTSIEEQRQRASALEARRQQLTQELENSETSSTPPPTESEQE